MVDFLNGNWTARNWDRIAEELFRPREQDILSIEAVNERFRWQSEVLFLFKCPRVKASVK